MSAMTDGSAIVCHGCDVEEGDGGRENGRESNCSITRPSVVSLSHRSNDNDRSHSSVVSLSHRGSSSLARAAASSSPSPAADLRLSAELARASSRRLPLPLQIFVSSLSVVSSFPSPAADRTISPELAPSRIPLPLQRQIFKFFSPTLSPRTASEHARCPLPLRRRQSHCSSLTSSLRQVLTCAVRRMQVIKLCDLGADDNVCSVTWAQRGTHLAIGTNQGKVQVRDVRKTLPN
ncbi:hypothetical protein ACLOJK_034568 [Asimina triloba]